MLFSAFVVVFVVVKTICCAVLDHILDGVLQRHIQFEWQTFASTKSQKPTNHKKRVIINRVRRWWWIGGKHTKNIHYAIYKKETKKRTQHQQQRNYAQKLPIFVVLASFSVVSSWLLSSCRCRKPKIVCFLVFRAFATRHINITYYAFIFMNASRCSGAWIYRRSLFARARCQRTK